MTDVVLRNYAGLSAAEYAEIAQAVRDHHGLDEIFAWGRRQSPAVHPTDVIKQDEFTHDVLVPLPGGRRRVSSRMEPWWRGTLRACTRPGIVRTSE